MDGDQTWSAPRNLLRWGLSAVAVCVLLWRVSVSGAEAIRTLQVDTIAAVTALVILIGYLSIYCERSRVLISLYLGRVPPLASFARTLLFSRIYNNFLPQAGNFYRAVSLRSELRLPYSGYLATSLAVVFFELLVLGMAVLWLFRGGGWHAVNSDLAAGSAFNAYFLLAVSGALVVLGGAECKRQLNVIRRHNRHSDKAVSLRPSDYLRVVFRFHFFISGVFQSFSLLVAMISVQWLVFFSLGHQLDISQALAFLVVNRMAQYMTVTPGNIGVRELIYGFIGASTGVGELIAVMASVLLRLLTWLALGSMLVIAFVSEKWTYRFGPLK